MFMTFKQFAEQYLINYGVSEDLAKAGVGRAMEYKLVTSQQWDTSIVGQPFELEIAVLLSVRAGALAWIEDNCPDASFKAAFQDDSALIRELSIFALSRIGRDATVAVPALIQALKGAYPRDN